MSKITQDITMDIVMPDMDGIAAIKAIVWEFPQAKIILCTSMGQEAVVEVIQAGAKVLSPSPFSRPNSLKQQRWF